MTAAGREAGARRDAALVAALFAIDPAGCGGVRLKSAPHALRDAWLQTVRAALPAATPWRRLPSHAAEGRLLGGLDLAATLRAGRAVAARGVLAEAHGGVLLLTMAERLPVRSAGILNAALDRGEIATEREGLALTDEARVAVIALDESVAAEEGVPASLVDRLAFALDLDALDPRLPLEPVCSAAEAAAARARLAGVELGDELVEALCATAAALGVQSLRTAVLAARVARLAAALAGRDTATEADAVVAGRLVLAPRASRAPQAVEDEPAAEPPAAPPPDGAAQDTPRDESPERTQPPQPLEERVIAAVSAALPEGLLESLRLAQAPRRGAGAGRAGVWRKAGRRGRPAGVRAGKPGGDARLDVLETLRAAAPWQGVRGRPSAAGAPLKFSSADFRVVRHREQARTLTLFAVDASGSAALHRLAETKGAVERLLADCYVRRDEVAVVAFRGRAADVLLPPTRSLVRAKRALAGLPGGGGTPLAAALDVARDLAERAQRRGDAPTLVLLSDCRANVTLEGLGGREIAQAQALAAARRLRGAGVPVIVIDTSPRPNPAARTLAEQMSARYLPLPVVDSEAIAGLVRAAQPRGG